MARKSDRIADLPSMSEIAKSSASIRKARSLANLFLKTGLGGKKAKQFIESADHALSQVEIIDLPDRFNSAFADRGWIATSSMSVDVMRAALKSHEAGDTESAEAIILEWVLQPEIINLFAINRSKAFNDATSRWHQLREALALTQEERYWSAVPLILIASDGLASDVLGTSPFEKNADLSLFDSVVAHPTALPVVISHLKKGVHKSSDDLLSLPLRHGILHGRSLGYANRIVCGKAWMLTIALVDWAMDRRDEGAGSKKGNADRPTKWREVLASVQRIQTERQAIERFVVRSWDGPFDKDLTEGDPPVAFNEFLSGWKTGNFGRMADRAINSNQKKHGHLAGQIRADAELIKLTDYEILSVRQTTVARAEARVFMHGETLTGTVQGEFMILAFRYTVGGKIAVLEDMAVWRVQQGCMFDLMNLRTINR